MGVWEASKVLEVILHVLGVAKTVGKGTFSKIAGAFSSRDQVFLLTAAYYVVYQNLPVFRTLDPIQITLALGSSILQADREIERNLREVASGSLDTVSVEVWRFGFSSMELAVIAAVLSIVGAVASIVLILRLTHRVLRAKNPNWGLDESLGVSFLVYGSAVVVLSAWQGEVRLPFQGVYVLIQNIDIFADWSALLEGDVSRNVTSPVLGDLLPEWVDPVNESAVNESSPSGVVNESLVNATAQD